MNVAAFSPAFDYIPFVREKRPRGRPLNVGLMAKMTWWPNHEGATWFADKILPHLDPSLVVAHYYGIGSKIFEGRRQNLHVHGFVDSLDKIWQTCDLMVCPILSGSGVNIKFAEAVFNRMPVLTTTMAARGLPPIEDEHITYLDQPREWIEFLSSPLALDLATGSVSARIADLYKPVNQRRQISDFLESVMAQDKFKA